MNKIGILTHYYASTNYGGLLQAYALTHFINTHSSFQAKQITYEIFNRQEGYSLQNPLRRKSIFQKIISKSFVELLRVTKEKLGTRVIFLIYGEKFKKRSAHCEQFRNSIPHTTGKVYNDGNIAELINDYDIFITGSDQVWNPNWYRKSFFLEFVPSSKKKIAYAASMGVDTLTQRQKDIFFPAINLFDFVSVREKTAQNMLQGLDIPVELVIDPVFLLTKEEWEGVCSAPVMKKPYLFRHFLTVNKTKLKIERKIAQLKSLYAVNVPYAKKVFENIEKWSENNDLNFAGPAEFLSLIKHSECIITDSFHAVAFSIIFNKQFFVVDRDAQSTKHATNSRLTDILSKFNLESRMIKDISELTEEKTSEKIDYSTINASICKEREKSIEFLFSALEST